MIRMQILQIGSNFNFFYKTKTQYLKLMYGRNTNNIFNRASTTPSTNTSSNNIFARNTNTNTTNSYGNSYANNNNSSYGSNNRTYGNSYNSSVKLGSARVINFSSNNPPRFMQDINPKWKTSQINPMSITTRPQTIHLSSIQLRIEDYYLMRTNKLNEETSEIVRGALQKGYLNSDLMNSHIVCNLKQPLTFKQGEVALDVLKQLNKNRALWASGTTSIYGNNNNQYNSTSNNTYSSSNNIFGRGNTTGGNVFNTSNNSSNNTSNNIFTSNNRTNNNIFNTSTNRAGTNNIFGNNTSNNSNNMMNRSSNNIFNNNQQGNSSGGNNIFSNSRTGTTNIFGTGGNNANNNIFNRNNSSTEGNNIFNRNGNNNSSGNIFTNGNNQQGNNIFNRNSNNIFTNNSSNIFNNGINGGNNIFNNGSNQSNNIFNRNTQSNNLFNNQQQNQQQQNNTSQISPATEFCILRILQANQAMFQNFIHQNKLQLSQNPNTNSFYDQNIKYKNQFLTHNPSRYPWTTLSNNNEYAKPLPLDQYASTYGRIQPLYDDYDQDQFQPRPVYNFLNSPIGISPQTQKIYVSDIYQHSIKPLFERREQIQAFSQQQFIHTENLPAQRSQQDIYNFTSIRHGVRGNSRRMGSQIKEQQSYLDKQTKYFCVMKFAEQPFNEKHKRFKKTISFQHQIHMDQHQHIITEWFKNQCHDFNDAYHIKKIDIPNINIQNRSVDCCILLTKINLPEGYFFRPKQFLGFNVKDLQIINQWGMAKWPGQTDIRGVDFSEGFSIQPCNLFCSIPQLDKECYVTFNTIPSEIMNLPLQQAEGIMSKFINRQSEDIKLQFFQINPPSFGIKITRFPESKILLTNQQAQAQQTDKQFD